VRFSNPFSNLKKILTLPFYKGIEIKESLDRHFDRLHKFKKEDIDEQLMKGEGVDCGKERY
jgi:hypothetical protein